MSSAKDYLATQRQALDATVVMERCLPPNEGLLYACATRKDCQNAHSTTAKALHRTVNSQRTRDMHGHTTPQQLRTRRNSERVGIQTQSCSRKQYFSKPVLTLSACLHVNCVQRQYSSPTSTFRESLYTRRAKSLPNSPPSAL